MNAGDKLIISALALVKFLQGFRFPLTRESSLQAAIELELGFAQFAFAREVRLSDDDIIDFMVGDIGLEVKVRGGRKAIYDQCERYCQHERVRALVLATNLAMGMPSRINLKPVYIANLGLPWLGS